MSDYLNASRQTLAGPALLWGILESDMSASNSGTVTTIADPVASVSTSAQINGVSSGSDLDSVEDGTLAENDDKKDIPAEDDDENDLSAEDDDENGPAAEENEENEPPVAEENEENEPPVAEENQENEPPVVIIANDENIAEDVIEIGAADEFAIQNVDVAEIIIYDDANAEAIAGAQANAVAAAEHANAEDAEDAISDVASDASTVVDAPEPAANAAVPQNDPFLDALVNLEEKDFMAINAGYFHYDVPADYVYNGVTVTIVIDGTSIKAHLSLLRACPVLYQMFVGVTIDGHVFIHHNTVNLADTNIMNSLPAWIILLFGIYGTANFSVGEGAYGTTHYVQALLLAQQGQAVGWLRDAMKNYMKNHCAKLQQKSDIYNPGPPGTQEALLQQIQESYFLYRQLPDGAKPFPETVFGVLAYRCLYHVFLMESLPLLHPDFYHLVTVAGLARAITSPWGAEDDEIFTIP
ncbi:hypothetical protein F5B20DRAFT_586775 [Whalleya microplaca]|nr:hypothetical protein F5B20DRAFT_586775 [Whalleya microplaca]